MKRPLLLLLIIFLSAFCRTAYAGTTYTWTGLGLDGKWTTAANWSPSTGYPGQSGTTDIAVVNISLTTITLNTSLTVSQLKSTLYGINAINIQFSGSAVLTITNGISTAQPVLASTGITFSGSGTANIGGTSQLGYQSSMAISSGATVNFTSGSTFSFPNNHSNLTNAGNLNFQSGSTLTLQDFSQLTNTGVLTSTKAAITLSGSGTPANIIDNQGTYTDHGSTITISGQNSAFKNSTSSSLAYLHGTTMNFTSSNTNMSLTNAGSLIADSSATINLGSYNCPITNTGNFYAGISNSSCVINLTAQGSNINNTGTFYVGSTSGITISGYQAAITTGSTAFFIFQSDMHGSAYLGSVPSSSVGLITGTYYVERYITGGSSSYRSYRLFSSPVYAGTVSGNKVYSLNYVKNSALVTGSGGTTGGFDKAGNPSLYLYRENIAFSNATFISGNFRGVANIASAPSYTLDTDGGPYNIPVGDGFLFFFRGDRTSNLANKYTPGTLAESVTMTATGSLNQGSYTVHDWYTPSSSNLGYTTTSGNTAIRGDNLVGNPYPSSIDWETFQTTTSTTGIYGVNVGNTIYVLNPLNQNYGAYIKGNGGVGTNNATNVIASGQGFFVVATSSSAQLIFNESAKTTAQNTGLKLFMGSPAGNIVSNSFLRLQLAKDSINTDETLVRFDNNSTPSYSGDYDAEYKPGFGKVSLSSLSGDNVALAINAIPLPKASESMKLSVSAKTDGIYQLSLTQINQLPRLFDVWLIDGYQKDSLDLRQNHTYSFNIYTTDSASYGSGRFRLVIRQNPEYAYHLLDFTAAKVQDATQTLITWKTVNEENYTNFTVERSTDSGKTFGVIASIPSGGTGNYSFTDKDPLNGQNLYRLEQEDVNGNITYSDIVPVLFTDKATSIAGRLSVYPNPATSTLNIAIPSKSNLPGSYRIMITNTTGLTVWQGTSSQSSWQGSIGYLPAGTYMVTVQNSKDDTIIGHSQFIKL